MEEINGRRRPQGRRRLTVQREQYSALMEQGIGNSKASRLVGIHVRTGRDWRRGVARIKVDGRSVRIPDSGSKGLGGYGSYRRISPRFLSENDRILIADLHRKDGGSAKSPAN